MSDDDTDPQLGRGQQGHGGRPSNVPKDGEGPQEQVPAPRVLDGRYEVGELIGRGGMAEVHVGHDLRLGRTVAIKILRADLARDSSFLARFRREAQSAAGLNHPSIVAVYDSGEQQTQEAGGSTVSVSYIVMEHVEGRTLRDLLNDERVLDPDEAARITAAVLAGLDYAHAKRIVHRDIKPANVMVTRGGAVKVMDFGIARALADTAATMTQTQAVLGTARYLSPEQAQGQDVDARSDLYSTGCLLYELLSGRTPFQGDPVALVYQHLGETPKAPSQHQGDLPQALDAITLHALEKTPETRYQSAGDFRDDLVAARTGAPISQGAQSSLARIVGGAAAGTAAAGGLDRTDPEQTQVVGAPAHQQGPRGARAGGAGAAAVQHDGYEDTDEIPVREERHRGGYFMLAALALLALAAIGFVVFQVLGADDTEDAPPQVAVPFLLQMTQERAQDELDQLGLEGEFTQEANQADEGEVFDQDPEANAMVEEGSAVQVLVSAGPDAITIPNVEGFREQEARNTLEDAGITVAEDTKETNDLDFDRGEVVSTRPGINQQVSPDEEVVLVLATGQTQVPDVVGEDMNDAVLQLREGRLDPVTTVEVTDEVDEGTVLEQSIEAGEEVDYDTEITLVVAQVPASTVTETETVIEPAPTSDDPDPTTEDPDPTTDDPDPTTDDPGPTTEDPDPTTEDPSPSTSPTTSPSPTPTPSPTSPTTEPSPTSPTTEPSPTTPTNGVPTIDPPKTDPTVSFTQPGGRDGGAAGGRGGGAAGGGQGSGPGGSEGNRGRGGGEGAAGP